MTVLSTEEIGFLTRFIVESDAIEGIHANPNLVRQQLQDNHTQGHVGAILFLHSLAQNRELLTHEIVQNVQGLITTEQHTKPGGPTLESKYIGRYRDVEVWVGEKACPPPADVPQLIGNWLSLTTRWQTHPETLPHLEKLEALSTLYFDYNFVHPFADGNGRSGRAIAYYLMKYSDVEPFIFTAKDRGETFYPAFRSRKYMHRYFTEKSLVTCY